VNTNDPLECYLGRFQAALRGRSVAERQDIVDEIRAHVHERMCVSGRSIPDLLDRLGTPEALAAEYVHGDLVPRQSAADTEYAFFRTVFAWVAACFHFVATVAVVVYGYGATLVCFGLFLVRMALPQITQVWMTSEWELGIGPDQPKDVQVFLLHWVQPLLFGLAVALMMLTTMAVRYLYPRFRRFKSTAIRLSGLPWFTGARSVVSSLGREAVEARRRVTLRMRTRLQNI
jgi:sulfur carrier protein ThiS